MVAKILSVDFQHWYIVNLSSPENDENFDTGQSSRGPLEAQNGFTWVG